MAGEAAAEVSMERAFVLMIGLVAAIAAGPAPEPQPSPGATARPNLSGHWRFDAASSDDARQKIRSAIEQRRGGGSGHWGGGGFGGHRGGGGGHWGRGAEAGHRRQTDRSQGRGGWSLEAPEDLAITQTDSEIVILEKDGPVRALHPHGTAKKDETTGTTVRSFWDGQDLEVETQGSNGGKTTESYELAPDGSQLVVTVRLQNKVLGDLTLKRVYEPVAAE